MKLLHRVTLLTFLLLLSVAAFAETHAREAQVKDTIKKAYDVRPGGTVYIDMDHGNIEIEAGGGNRVVIELERIARADDRDMAEQLLAQHEYSFDLRGNDVSIRSRFDQDSRFMKRWRNRTPLKISVTVQVPEQYNVEFTSGAGNVDVVDVNGRIQGRTGAGNIVLDDVRGIVDISSGAGNIDVEGDVERAEISTGAGNVNLYGLTGAVDANTGAGNIYAEITRQPDQDSELSSGAGNVTVRLSERVGVYVDATAALGSAECEFALQVEGKWLKKSFSGAINGGGPELRMHTGVGNVALLRD